MTGALNLPVLGHSPVTETSKVVAQQQPLPRHESRCLFKSVTDAIETQPRENDTDATKVGLAQEVYRCFTLDETSQICEGRGPFLETLASDADRSRVTASFKALHDVEIAGPAPWAGLHRAVTETPAERNAPGEKLAGRSAPESATRFPTREK